MPGHEGTTRTNTEDYSIPGQVKRIHQVATDTRHRWLGDGVWYFWFINHVFLSDWSQFVETVRLNRKPFHLVGTSMGGNVAGVYAACYPSDICSITLICPDGQSPLLVCVCVCVRSSL